MLTDFPRALLVPHSLIAFTEIVPPVVPTTTLMVLVVEDPVHPDGNVHA